LQTVGTLTPNRRANRVLFSPSAHANTMRLRNANACALFGRRAHRSNCSRAPSASEIATGFSPRELIHNDHQNHQRTNDTEH
jgi:hypothetical protein